MLIRFQPTRPLRGATLLLVLFSKVFDFNPRAPCGARQHRRQRQNRRMIFQPTRPLRGATLFPLSLHRTSPFQPTRPLRGATYSIVWVSSLSPFQPTRPLRGATTETVHKSGYTSISTHAPLAGRDCSVRDRCHKYFIFQPTRPLRGATERPGIQRRRIRNFNPRAPCGARLIGGRIRIQHTKFQPTRPLRGATIMDWFGDTFFIISTHAPLAGRDGAGEPT